MRKNEEKNYYDPVSEDSFSTIYIKYESNGYRIN